MSLYETLKAAKIGVAPDVFTTLRAQIAPFAKDNITEKELEDIPPLSFTANGEPLIDWKMDGSSGGVGDKTSNLFYKKMSGANINAVGTIISNSEYDIVVAKVEAGETYSVSGCSAIMGFYVDEPELNSQSYNQTRETIVSPVTIPEGVTYAAYRVSQRPNVAMMNRGSTALPYEPSGYKVTVTCGGETRIIYLDAPLEAFDSISMTDTGILIPTVDGSNTLTVDTMVQPSNVYIKYKE